MSVVSILENIYVFTLHPNKTPNKILAHGLSTQGYTMYVISVYILNI